MKKRIIFIIISLLFISENLFSESWMTWFKDRTWVTEDKIKIPIYEAINDFVKHPRWKVEERKNKNQAFFYLTAKTYLTTSSSYVPIKVTYLAQKNPLRFYMIYFKMGELDTSSKNLALILLAQAWEENVKKEWLKEKN